MGLSGSALQGIAEGCERADSRKEKLGCRNVSCVIGSAGCDIEEVKKGDKGINPK